MKKFMATLLTLCVICASGYGLSAVSAASVLPDTSLETGETGEITVFASSDIGIITYSITSTNYSAVISLNRICSGNVYMELQKKDGSSWSYKDSTTWGFNNKVTSSGSKSFSITESGIYRISISITIDSVTTVRQSGEHYF